MINKSYLQEFLELFETLEKHLKINVESRAIYLILIRGMLKEIGEIMNELKEKGD